MNNKKINTNNSNLPIVPLELILSLREDFGDLVSLEGLKLFRFDTSKYWDFNEAFVNYKNLAYKRRVIAKSKARAKARLLGPSSAVSPSSSGFYETTLLLKINEALSIQERQAFYEGNFLVLRKVKISDTKMIFVDNQNSVWEPIVTEPNVIPEEPLYERKPDSKSVDWTTTPAPSPSNYKPLHLEGEMVYEQWFPNEPIVGWPLALPPSSYNYNKKNAIQGSNLEKNLASDVSKMRAVPAPPPPPSFSNYNNEEPMFYWDPNQEPEMYDDSFDEPSSPTRNFPPPPKSSKYNNPLDLEPEPVYERNSDLKSIDWPTVPPYNNEKLLDLGPELVYGRNPDPKLLTDSRGRLMWGIFRWPPIPELTIPPYKKKKPLPDELFYYYIFYSTLKYSRDNNEEVEPDLAYELLMALLRMEENRNKN